MVRELTEAEISEAQDFLAARFERACASLEFLQADQMAITWFRTCWERDYWREKYIELKINRIAARHLPRQ